MSINLKNAIVILDEGHNIEDICREGASMEMTLEKLNEYNVDCLPLLKSAKVASYASKLIKLIKSLTSFIETLSTRLVFVNEDILKKTWDSKEAVKVMEDHNLDLSSIIQYKSDINALTELIKKQESEEFSDLPVIKTSILNELGSAMVIFQLMLNEYKDIQSDFRVVVMEGGTFTDLSKDSEISLKDGTILLSAHRRKRKNQTPKTNYILNILCMNPGIVFKDISAVTHSIILASGTLSPMTSFQTELSCIFDTSLEAGHVVKLDQTMIASVSCGPRGISLQATYANVETLAFQDELGALLLSCCKAVPYGVLCFVSSFHLIDKLFKRWQATSLVEELQKCKTVLIEPRNSTEMNKCMKDYESFVENGALLLAVYRGKASEGMDFSDNAARLVIAVGIPYPSLTDFKVKLKKEYNDNKCKLSVEKSRILSGKEWYSIQAYRALNQALGRCIRHRKDWGAMILVDQRFSSDYYNQGLCKWIKQRKRHFENWTEFSVTLDKFVTTHLERSKEESNDI